MVQSSDSSLRPSPTSELAQVRGVSKTFAAVAAVKDASCTFSACELHAVCGENGAGKSTLLKMVAGLIRPDAGEVLVGGAVLSPPTPREAIARKVAMVLQHFSLVPALSVLENIILGAEPRGWNGLLDRKASKERVERVLAQLGVSLSLDAPVASLGVADRQRVEIARALFRDASLIILDEPTAVLAPMESTRLYQILRGLVHAGKGVVIVTHKMDEVRLYADCVTVMRRGRVLSTETLDRGGNSDATIDRIVSEMMGARGTVSHAAATVAAPLAGNARDALLLEGVTVPGALDSLCVAVRAHEIVGVAGVEGNGQRELVAVLAGELRPTHGVVRTERVAIVREDRHEEGLVLDASVRDNAVLGELDRFSRWGVLDLPALEAEATRRVECSGAPRDLDRPIRELSGGNQQKICVERALQRDASLLVVSQPTRGVDLGARADIHDKLKAAAEGGAGILVISSDLDELRSLAARLVVLVRGRIHAELPPTASDDEIGRYMLGLGAVSTLESKEPRA
jgi:ABC-type uncharacterized transport system ATPase subunit